MRDVRFGSYSTAATLAGMPYFSRRKSIRRYRRLCPPPCHRLVMWPLLLRPPVRRSGSSSDFSGSLFVTSAKSETERNRVPGVIGRNCRMPISALEHGDRVAFFECDDRLLPRRATARPARGETAGAAPGAHDQTVLVRHLRGPPPPLHSRATRFPPAPAAPPPPRPPTGSRTPSRPRTASRARRGYSAPTDRRCTRWPRRP